MCGVAYHKKHVLELKLLNNVKVDLTSVRPSPDAPNRKFFFKLHNLKRFIAFSF
jgi:hypothetical protein